MIEDMGASAEPIGLSPEVEPTSCLDGSATSIPSALPLWRMRTNIRHHLMTGLIHRSTGKDPKNDGYTFAEVPDWQLREWSEVVERAAQAMERSLAARPRPSDERSLRVGGSHGD